MKFSKVIFVAFTAAILLSMSCKTSKDTENGKVTETILNKIPEGEWEMQSMNQKSVEANTFGRSLPTIIFKDSTSFSGTTGCNQYIASYKNNPEHFAVKMGPMTKMACPGNGEKEFVSALSSANRTTVQNGILTFYKGEAQLMKFKKSEPIKEK